MSSNNKYRYNIIAVGTLFFLLFFYNTLLSQETNDRVITQGEFAKLLVEKGGLKEKGIPLDEELSDYFSLLQGGKSFTIEGEDFKKSLGSLIVNKFPEGGGWVTTERGIERIEYSFDAPQSGIYWLRCKVKGTSQFWTVDQEKTEILNPISSFQWADIRKYILSRGPHKVTVALPNKGGLDQFLFSADNLKDVTPNSGWQPSKPLTYGVMAELLVKFIEHENKLPVDETYIFKYKILEKRFSTNINYAVGKFLLIIEDSGVYTLETDVRGEKPIPFYIKGGKRIVHPQLKQTGKLENYLTMYADNLNKIVDIPKYKNLAKEEYKLQHIVTAYFKKGEYIIEILLPPFSSVETVHRLKRRATSYDYLQILKDLGIRVGNVDEPVKFYEIEDILSNEKFKNFIEPSSSISAEYNVPPLTPPEIEPIVEEELIEVQNEIGPPSIEVISPSGAERIE